MLLCWGDIRSFSGVVSLLKVLKVTNLSKTLAYRSLGGPPFGPRPLVGELVRYFFEKGSKWVRYHHAKTTSHKKTRCVVWFCLTVVQKKRGTRWDVFFLWFLCGFGSGSFFVAVNGMSTIFRRVAGRFFQTPTKNSKNPNPNLANQKSVMMDSGVLFGVESFFSQESENWKNPLHLQWEKSNIIQIKSLQTLFLQKWGRGKVFKSMLPQKPAF